MFLEHIHPSRVLPLSYISHVLFYVFHNSPCINPLPGVHILVRALWQFLTLEKAVLPFSGWPFEAHISSVCLGVEVL